MPITQPGPSGAPGRMNMKNSQRWLIVVSCFLLALAAAIYCLDYRVSDYYSRGDDGLFVAAGSPPIPGAAPVPVIKLNEGNRRTVPGTSNLFVVTVSTIYPRLGMTVGEAAIGGLLVPFVLIIIACYLGLGAPLPSVENRASAPAAIAADGPLSVTANDEEAATAEQLASLARMDVRETWCPRAAAVAVAVLPVLFLLDMPSMMLLMRLRFSRWLFAILLLRAFGAAKY